jgi:hypothetical protein
MGRITKFARDILLLDAIVIFAFVRRRISAAFALPASSSSFYAAAYAASRSTMSQ